MAEKKDLTEGKSWFQIMWKNFYIQIFAIAILMLVYTLYRAGEIIDYSGAGWLVSALAIPVMMMAAIGYFGFYQFWKDLKSGRSR